MRCAGPVRHEERKRRRQVIFHITLSPVEIEALAEKGYFAGAFDDKVALRRAVETFLSDHLE